MKNKSRPHLPKEQIAGYENSQTRHTRSRRLRQLGAQRDRSKARLPSPPFPTKGEITYLERNYMPDFIEITSKKSFIIKSMIAFLVSVTVAAGLITLCFVAIMFLSGATETQQSTFFQEAILLLFIIHWAWAFLFSIIPYTLSLTFILQNKTRVTRRFIIGGAILTALLQAPIAGSIPNLGINSQGIEDDAFLLGPTRYLIIVFSICGIAAGFTCWRILRLREK